MTRRRRATLLAAGVLLVASGCTDGSSRSVPAPTLPTPAPATAPADDASTYVALGDSYVSGPGIEPMDKASNDCFRSRVNWPALLSERLESSSFRDVSCAGATTSHLDTSFLSSDNVMVPAQVKAISEDTEIVTVGIGGNDEGVFGALVGACSTGRGDGPDRCTPFISQKLPPLLETVQDNVTRALGRIRQAAPSARVLLVGYLRVLPDRQGCEDAGVSGRTVELLTQGEQALDDTLSAAAETAGVEFVSLRDLATGHDACSGPRAWVNGIDPGAGDGVLLHPNAAGMRAIADVVAARLGRPAR